jgi:hypothetical protein
MAQTLFFHRSHLTFQLLSNVLKIVRLTHFALIHHTLSYYFTASLYPKRNARLHTHRLIRHSIPQIYHLLFAYRLNMLLQQRILSIQFQVDFFLFIHARVSLTIFIKIRNFDRLLAPSHRIQSFTKLEISPR